MFPAGTIPRFDALLNPMFKIEDAAYVMVTQIAAAAPLRGLGRPVGSLAHEDFTVTAAFDMLLTGY